MTTATNVLPIGSTSSIGHITVGEPDGWRVLVSFRSPAHPVRLSIEDIEHASKIGLPLYRDVTAADWSEILRQAKALLGR